MLGKFVQVKQQWTEIEGNRTHEFAKVSYKAPDGQDKEATIDLTYCDTNDGIKVNGQPASLSDIQNGDSVIFSGHPALSVDASGPKRAVTAPKKAAPTVVGGEVFAPIPESSHAHAHATRQPTPAPLLTSPPSKEG